MFSIISFLTSFVYFCNSVDENPQYHTHRQAIYNWGTFSGTSVFFILLIFCLMLFLILLHNFTFIQIWNHIIVILLNPLSASTNMWISCNHQISTLFLISWFWSCFSMALICLSVCDYRLGITNDVQSGWHYVPQKKMYLYNAEGWLQFLRWSYLNFTLISLKSTYSWDMAPTGKAWLLRDSNS